MGLNVGFTGTRNGMTDAQKRGVRMLMEEIREKHEGRIFFHHGLCKGADSEAHYLAREEMDALIVGHPPSVSLYREDFAPGEFFELLPEAPYAMRNQRIVDRSDLMIATPATMKEILHSGTWQTIRFTIKAEKGLAIVTPSGIISTREFTSYF